MLIKTTDDLGQIVRAWRKAKGLTQKRLAAIAGLTQRRISVIENGTNEPELQTAIELLAILGIPLSAPLPGENVECRKNDGADPFPSLDEIMDAMA